MGSSKDTLQLNFSGLTPFLEQETPIPFSIAPLYTSISFFIVDGGTGIGTAYIDAYVDGYDAYNDAGFIPPYNGIGSSFTFLPGGSLDGYDAYRVVLDPLPDGYFSIGDTITVRVTALDGYLSVTMDESWSFIIDDTRPFLEQEDPSPGSFGANINTNISCYVVDGGTGIEIELMDAYINGVDAYQSGIGFVPPFNGPNSDVVFYPAGSLGGYDAYEVIFDPTASFTAGSLITTRIVVPDGYNNFADESWSFRIGYGPFIEQQDPVNWSINIPVNKEISCFITDADAFVMSNSIDAYINGIPIYDGLTDTFQAPFNGPNSSVVFVPGGSTDGYDGYLLTVDRVGSYPFYTIYFFRVTAEDTAGINVDSTWLFRTESGPTPQIKNILPLPGAIISQGSLISFDIFDKDNNLDPTTISITVDSSLAYSGFASSFYSPYTGIDSYSGPKIVDGYDGYHLVLDNIGNFGPIVSVNAQAQDAYGNLLNYSWGYTSDASLNRVYYSDDYGVYKIDIQNLVGESQFVATRFLSTSTAPSIPTNKVVSLSGNYIDGYSVLVLSMGPDGYGTNILLNEAFINTYADGYYCNKSHINNRGILYLVNKTRNRIEVYYGANTRPGALRPPDYFYDGYSTPALFSNGGNIGEILSLHIVNDESTELDIGTRLYVGQSIGMTIIDTYDQESAPGFSAGLDSYGSSTTCGITGSGATYECVGGVVPRVTDVATDERYGVIFVVTNDGYGHGGLTQVKMSPIVKLFFMDKDSGFVPSNDIRKVSKNE